MPPRNLRGVTSSSGRAARLNLAVVRTEIRDLSPAYFALVMATGIVSIAAHFLDLQFIAIALFWLNVIAYLILWVMTILRVIWYRHEFLHDMADHQRGPGFFTLVAATCLLGGQFIRILDNYFIAAILWVLGVALWVGLTYIIFTVFTVKENKPSLAEGISGAWLLAVVATQAISVLSALLAAHWAQPYRLETNFLALSMWLWGGMLYIWMISLIFYRYTFFKFFPGDLSPPYWINMGAMAISALAGGLLILNSPDAPFLNSLLPFLKGFTIFYWATGTWWIPMLVILAVWRHLYKRFPLEYDPLYWGAVFPLGMYTVATFQIGQSMELEFLYFISHNFIYLALLAWLVTFAGLLRRIGNKLFFSAPLSS
ncbi:MAG: C4-dicarboxylate ABC transporter [Chloroflexi bacterium UTCFX4]|jgi:tellurite resistance protein TehA-like permease|nr:MAG: C4-dicarboxylate ABC transporter [Chloroflexi bacterium UTCFX4]